MNSKYYLSTKCFKGNNFSVVRNFIPQEKAIFLYEYTKMFTNSINFKKEKYFEKWDSEWDGNWDCPQAPGTFSKYGDSVMDTLGLWTLKDVEKYTGHQLDFTYSYWRLYEKDDVLEYHKDRKSCDISATLCLGWNSENLKDQNYCWSFYIEKTNGEKIGINLGPGDAIFYKGCELFHWRNRCEALNHGQVFLHYNNKNSKQIKDDKNPGDGSYLDGRIFPGIPKRYQRDQFMGGLYEWHQN